MYLITFLSWILFPKVTVKYAKIKIAKKGGGILYTLLQLPLDQWIPVTLR